MGSVSLCSLSTQPNEQETVIEGQTSSYACSSKASAKTVVVKNANVKNVKIAKDGVFCRFQRFFKENQLRFPYYGESQKQYFQSRKHKEMILIIRLCHPAKPQDPYS